MAADPKPEKRHRENTAGMKLIRDEFAGEFCRACGLPWDDLHHITPRSQGGGDEIANLVPLCHSCHMRFEDHSPDWEKVGHRIRAYVMARQSRLDYVMDRLGQDRFDARYPAPPWYALGDLARSGRPDPTLREN